jgi:hypothetical protein
MQRQHIAAKWHIAAKRHIAAKLEEDYAGGPS